MIRKITLSTSINFHSLCRHILLNRFALLQNIHNIFLNILNGYNYMCWGFSFSLSAAGLNEAQNSCSPRICIDCRRADRFCNKRSIPSSSANGCNGKFLFHSSPMVGGLPLFSRTLLVLFRNWRIC